MIRVSQAVTGMEELEAVRKALDRGYYGFAEKVIEFEEALRAYLGTGLIITTNTGTSALHLSLDALGIGRGDEVIVPSLTFIGSFQAISAVGATAVPCDIYPNTLLMSVEDVKKKITPKTRAIMPVHYAGNPCEIDALLEIKEKRGIRIIEDAAHALGSCYKEKKIGSFGDITCFSFDSIKNITCMEGGAIICRDEDFADILRQKRLLGIDKKTHTASWKERRWFFEVNTQGFRYHMSNVCAAIGLEQLRKIGGFITRRREICKKYDAAFSKIPLVETLKADYDNVAPHIYVIRVKDGKRDALMAALKDLDIETGINYIPNHLHLLYKMEDVYLPETEKAYEEILTLPLHCALSCEDADRVIEGVSSFFKK